MKSFLTKGMALSVIAALLVIPALAQQTAQPAKPAGEKIAAEKINLNTGTLDDLQKLTGVGPKIAQRILDFRKQNGPFKKIEDLMKVKGIGEKTFGKFKDMLTV
jgi:competence protein ComEA